MNEYIYIGIVITFIGVMSLLLHFANKRQDAKRDEEAIKIGMARKKPNPFPKENKVKLPEPKAPKSMPLIEVATRAVKK